MSLGFFAFPLPKARRTFPWHPYSHQSLLSFPSGTPASLLIVPGAHRPPEAPLPCGCTRFPLAPWHPLGSQLSRPMSLRFPVPTTLAESCPGPRGASEGTAGAAAPRSATHVVLGLRGVGGGGLCGDTAKPAQGIKLGSARTDCGGPGSELLPLQPAPPGLG